MQISNNKASLNISSAYIRYDLLHILYAGMLLHFSRDQILQFWRENPLPGYTSDNECKMFTELWQGRNWYQQELVCSILTNFESFLQKCNGNLFTFISTTFHKINKGLLISPRDWLVWSKSILEQIFSDNDDIRFLVLKLLDHYNSKIAIDLHYSIVHHSIRDGEYTTIMMISNDKQHMDCRMLLYDCEIWSAFLLKNLPVSINLPAYENYFILGDCRNANEIIRNCRVEKDSLSIDGEKIANQITFQKFCDQHQISIEGMPESKQLVWLVEKNYFCPDRKRIILHKGCVYGAPVYLFGYHYKTIYSRPSNFLDSIIDDIANFKDELWADIKKRHSDFLATLHPEISFTYDRKSEIMYFNGEYLIRNVPAKILKKILTIYIKTGRCRFFHSEFIKDEQIIENQLNPNFIIRLQRLTMALNQHNIGITLKKPERGTIFFSTNCKIEYSECN